MPPDSPEYDVFFNYATEDLVWCEKLASLLRDRGARLWFDKWEMIAGDHLEPRLNDGLKNSRKMIAVWSKNYFRDDKVWTLAERYSRQHSDPVSKQRPLIPVLIDNKEEIDIPPLFSDVLYVDFRNKDNFDLSFRELLNSLDLPQRQSHSEERFESVKQEIASLDPIRLPDYERDKSFEIEVAELYDLLGYEPAWDTPIKGGQIDLSLKKREGGVSTHIILECREKRITSDEQELILNRHRFLKEKLPRYHWIVVSAQGFDLDSQSALEDADITCITYSELLGELAPLDKYVNGLISEYEQWRKDHWEGQDRFIRPNLITDITYEERAALAHVAEWLDDPRAKQLVILGDVGTGKTMLARFLAYDLAQNFRKDPLRHPAPVLIPLKEVRKKVDLESIITAHLNLRDHSTVNFKRYEYLMKKGKIVTIFDEFDAMADRVKWETTEKNFQELSRIAKAGGKFILTCRTHYFKDKAEQRKALGFPSSLTESDTKLYAKLREDKGEAVYLKEFDDNQIKEYLGKARAEKADGDWKKIEDIYNLKELANRPLLLDMIVKSLPDFKPGDAVNAASLYRVYTNLWLDRDYKKGHLVLNKDLKEDLMTELAWRMHCEEKKVVDYRELISFLKRSVQGKPGIFGDEEIEAVAGELQRASFLKHADKAGFFAFMHKSFMEYFLAVKLYKALIGSEKILIEEALNTRLLDQKVIFFLTLLDENDEMREPLQKILTGGYVKNVSENALQILYWSGRIRLGMEEEIGDVEKLRSALAECIPAGVQLTGANLNGIVLEGAELDGANMSKADLTGANLNNILLRNVDLSEAKLTGASVNNFCITTQPLNRTAED